MFVLYTGLDATQKGKSNNGGRHAVNLRKWKERNDGGLIDYSNVRSGWIISCTGNGLNGAQTANVASDFFGKFPIENGGTIPRSEQGLFGTIYVLCLRINICFCVFIFVRLP